MTKPFNPFETPAADVNLTQVVTQEKQLMQPSQGTEIAPAPTGLSVSQLQFHFNEQNISSIGVDIAKKFTSLNGTLSAQMKAAAFDSFGDQLSALLTKTRSVDPSALTASKKPQGWINSLKSALVDMKAAVMREFQTVKSQVDQIVIELDVISQSQQDLIAHMERTYTDNHALHQALAQEMARVVALLEADKAMLQGIDPKTLSVMELQLFNDQMSRFDRVESRLAEMDVFMRICEQTAPEIRQYQDNARMLVGKFESFKTFGLLLWQRQFDKAVANLRQKKAIEVARDTANFTNEMLLSNSQMSRDNTVQAGIEARRGLVDIDTYEKANENLINMLQDVINNVGSAKAAREDAQRRMREANGKLLDTMQSLDQARAVQHQNAHSISSPQ